MSSLLARFIEAFVRLLPATLARMLLVLSVMGALGLHLWAMERIHKLEMADADRRVEVGKIQAQNSYVLRAVEDLTVEIRGYREDIRSENKNLRQLKAGSR